MTDGEIIALYWQREARAIEESGRKYGSFVRRIALNILRDRRDCEECVSDVWLKAWNAMPPEKPVYLGGFFGRLTRNAAISRYRSEHAQKRYAGVQLMLEELEGCIPAPQTVERQLEGEELAAFINSWLAALQPEERVLFVKRYWYGISVAELARERGISPSSAAQRLYRLRQRLRAALEKGGLGI